MSTDPAREEAWNCNRCRDRRLIVWNGVATPCDRCAPVVAMAKAVVLAKAAAAAADYQASMDKVAEVFAEVGSLPLPEEMQPDGGAGAGSDGGPSCAVCHNTGHISAVTFTGGLKYVAVKACPECSNRPPAIVVDRWAHTDPCCKGGPDCLCEPEGL